MNRKTITPVGALHPILFFAGVYMVVLLFSIFICSSIFYSCNTSKADMLIKEEKQTQPATPAYTNTTTVASLR
jgi:hypothetical protein